MSENRVFTTGLLLAAMDDARRHSFNRQADIEEIRKVIDPAGLHVASVMLMFHQASPERELPDHHRISIFVKPLRTMEPIELVIDVETKYWDAAVDAELMVEIIKADRTAVAESD